MAKPVGKLRKLSAFPPIIVKSNEAPPPAERIIERVERVVEPPSIDSIVEALKGDKRFVESLRGPPGAPGIGAGGGEGASQQKPSVNYIQVRGPTYTIDKKQLVAGQNIIGVNYAGPVTVYLPKRLSPHYTLYIKDESGAASTNNITIQLET